MSNTGLHLHVISHTHWDREWYQPFEQFRLRLVDLVDHLLEIFDRYPDYIFELDAQTVCLEDYLEIRPERRAILKHWIRKGNLRVGPWYVQNDFFLTSGEATIRNLLTGRRIAREFGKCGDVGYAPDQFGLIRQLPQILAGFGIDSCIFGRGFDRSAKNEFFWESPDGSRVLASFLSRWYNNLQRLSADPEKAAKFAELAVVSQNDEAATPHRLLMNGVDHLEAQEDLPEVLKHLPEFRQSTLRAFIDGVKADSAGLPVIAAEMRGGDFSSTLPGTLSAWVPLKMANVRAQAELEWKLEPLSVMLALAAGDWSFYETEPLRYAWKLLLQNHPHDSICGCSTPRVHADNRNRFARLNDLTDGLEDRLFRRFFERLDRSSYTPDDYLLAVFNPAPHPSSEELTAVLQFPLEENVTGFELRSPCGKQVGFELISRELRTKTSYPAINLPGKNACTEYRIRFSAGELPPMGYRVYTVRPLRGVSLETPAKCRLENGRLAFRVDPAGRLFLTDLHTGKEYQDLITFRDEADIGHTYNFFPAPDPAEINIPAVSRIEVEHKPDCVEVRYRFSLPRDYDFARKRRSAETEEKRLTVRYSLKRHATRLSVEIEAENRSAAHRLRALFRTGSDTGTSVASVPFGFETRKRDGSPRGNPNSGIVKVDDLAVFNQGLYEYEHREDGFLALTLLRCVGRITNSDFPEQSPMVAEAREWESPEANLIGTHTLRLAVRPGNAGLAELETEFRKFIMPAATAFDSADGRKFTSGRPCVQDTEVTEIFFRPLPAGTALLPAEYSLLKLRGNAVFSALKRSERRDEAVLRLYNPDFSRPAETALDTRFRYTRCDLAERNTGKVSMTPTLRPGEILTLKIRRPGFPAEKASHS